MSADGIQFGELEESGPRASLRPDENRHFAVVALGEPNELELPIFIDVDVLREMEAHAQEDTRVELGGVMLGGQYVDEQGKPFVVVTDSLRAEHYESTKGSFKFTHDTWAEITRQRDEFPEELEMIGWYHTHPGWGVFLSGMDMFICDHFFNRPLDVAFVIDPIRGDRGMFQWTGDEAERVRRVGGFYLTASRFREDELTWYAQMLEENPVMARAMQQSGTGPYPAPVIHVGSDRQTPWLATAVLGMLTVQVCLLALVAWQWVSSRAEPAAETSLEVAVQTAQFDAQQKLLEDVAREIHNTPEGFVQSLVQARQQNQQLAAANLGLQSRLQVIERGAESVQTELDAVSARLLRARDTVARLESEKLELTKANEALNAKDTEKGARRWLPDWPIWAWFVIGAVAFALGGGGLWTGWTLRARRDQMESADQEVPQD